MKLYSEILIQAERDVVWALISEPEFIPQWNQKIVQIKPLADPAPALGREYRFTFKMSRKEQLCEASITELNAPQSLTWRFQGLHKQKRWLVEDSYQLTQQGGGTQLKRCLDMQEVPIPRWIRPLIWYIMKFGKPVGQSELEKLRALAE